MGPLTVAFFKGVYGRAKEEDDKFLMSQQPALKHSRNTMVASSFWDMRLSILCAATDNEYQNRIILRDNPSTSRPGAASLSRPSTTPAMRRTRRRASLSPLKGTSQERGVPVSEFVH